jgi:hypothetical protein
MQAVVAEGQVEIAAGPEGPELAVERIEQLVVFGGWILLPNEPASVL